MPSNPKNFKSIKENDIIGKITILQSKITYKMYNDKLMLLFGRKLADAKDTKRKVNTAIKQNYQLITGG